MDSDHPNLHDSSRMTNPIRTVLFDAGNTLLHLDYPFIADMLRQHGHRRSIDEVRRAEYAAKAAIDEFLAPLLAAPGSIEGLLWPSDRERPSYFAIAMRSLGIDGADAEPVLEALRRHNEEDCLWRVVEPDTVDVLDGLRRHGLRLGVVSNSDGRIEGDIERRGLRSHFETVVDSAVVGVEKPDPAIFHIALGRMSASPEEALFVGDVFAIDVLGARAAGLDAILLDPLGGYPGNVDCRRIRSLRELLELVEGNAKL
jgi:putative hydrolase of the HAD superfamily